MTVKELSTEQFEELRESYYFQLRETDEDVLEDYLFPSDIPDKVIQDHYEGTEFVTDDFFCTAGQ